MSSSTILSVSKSKTNTNIAFARLRLWTLSTQFGLDTICILDFAIEFEVEYTVLGAVDDGLTDVEKIRDRVFSNVRALSDYQAGAVDDAIDRLVKNRY